MGSTHIVFDVETVELSPFMYLLFFMNENGNFLVFFSLDPLATKNQLLNTKCQLKFFVVAPF